MQLFYLQVQIFYFTFAYLSGKPGHSPNNIVEGGGISKRLLQITSFSAMFFYVRMSANDPAGILAQIRSRPARRSPENSGQKILNAQTRQQMQPVLSLYLHPDSSTHTHDPTHILPYPRHLLPADRHRTGRRHHPQCDVHGRLPRQHAGHSGTRARHESRRRDSPAGRHRLPRQGHFVPRPAGQSPQTGALNRRSDRSGTDFAHGAADQNRNTMYFVWYLLLGLASGWIANLIVKGNGSGLIVNLVVGLIGGVLGGWLFSFFGLVPAGTLGSLATSVIGAVVLLWIAAAISHKKIR